MTSATKLDEMFGWVKVRQDDGRAPDKLPPVGVSVLAYWGTHCAPDVVFLTDDGRWLTADDSYDKCDAIPTHWSRIPSPDG